MLYLGALFIFSVVEFCEPQFERTCVDFFEAVVAIGNRNSWRILFVISIGSIFSGLCTANRC